MAFLQKNIVIFTMLLVSSWSNALTSLETYQGLQSLRSSLSDAYVYALIVDVDSRAHAQRNIKLDKIAAIAKTLSEKGFFNKEEGQELALRIRLYLRSARNEANTYDERLGSRTLNNGYGAYSESVGQIKLMMSALEQSHNIPRNVKISYVLLNFIAMSIEIHSERVINSGRFEGMSQASLDTMCDKIERKLSALKGIPNTRATVKKAMSKWAMIKKPVCNLDKTSAPYTVVYYGGMMIGILQKANEVAVR